MHQFSPFPRGDLNPISGFYFALFSTVFPWEISIRVKNCIFVDHGRPPARVSRHLIHREWFGLARGYAYPCRRTIAIAAIMPKGIRMKSAMRMPIAKPFASGERPGGTATNRVSQSSSFMVPSELRIQYTDIAAVTELNNPRRAQLAQRIRLADNARYGLTAAQEMLRHADIG